MPPRLRTLAALLVASAVVLAGTAGCTQASLPGARGSSHGGSGAVQEGTCWTGATLDADPQDVLRLARRLGVPYLVAARALAERPSFTRRVGCAHDHAVEVYKVLRLPKLEAKLTDYAALLRTQSPLYEQVAASVATGCMTRVLARAVGVSGLPGAVMSPVLPEGASLGWAPAAPDRWAKGQRVFACTLTWKEPQKVRYAALFTKAFPTAKRTCIDSSRLVFVDCVRRHDRERIAVIEARDAVAAGSFPGPKAIRNGPNGRYLAVPDGRWAKLDAACTAYLRAVSTTKKLSGVANVDTDEWPAPGGSYPIYCDADTRPDQDSLITQGSVYDRS